VNRFDAQWRLRGAAFLSSFDRFTIPPLIVPIHDEFGVSLGAAAVLASAYFIAYGASQPLWGALSDRVGRVTVLRAAVLAGGLASLVAAVAPSFALLLAARTLSGLFFAAVVPTAITYIGDTVGPQRRQQSLVVMMAYATSGLAVATIVGGVAAQLIGWRAAFVATAALSVFVLALVWPLTEPTGARAEATLGGRLRTLARHPWVWVVVGLAFLEGSVIFGSLPFVAAALQQDGVGAALAGSAVAGFGIANALCTPVVTRTIPRVASPLLIAGGGGVAAAGLGIAAVDSTVVTALLATLALGTGFGFLHSTLQMWATQVHPPARAVTVSLFASAIFVGGALASAAAAPLADDGHFGTIFVLAAMGAALLAIAGAGLRQRYGAAAGSEEPAALAV
jgi:predicted MFS family arabinose efflux permease